MQQHYIRFLRCVAESGQHQAICSCGWSIMGDLDYVAGRASTHDLDDKEPVHEAPLLREGFVSGLSDR